MLNGKVALVTGAARGIGAGIARVMAAQGAYVALLDLDGDEAKRTADALTAPGLGIGCDVAIEADVREAVRQAAEHFGGLDIVVNNAGAGRGPFDPTIAPSSSGLATDMSAEVWDGFFAQNLRSNFVTTKAAVPHLKARGGGSIVNMSSIAGIVASPSLPPYAAAKAGVISLTKSLALDLAPHDIRVNAICPGFLWTRAWEGMATAIQRDTPELASSDPHDIFLAAVKRSVPLGREQTPEDVGHLAAFLASDVARNITGQWIAVDGGITLRQYT